MAVAGRRRNKDRKILMSYYPINIR
ncbi:MAG: hypothetical protein ACD_75C00470G0012, partial [uncultured bacterium]